MRKVLLIADAKNIDKKLAALRVQADITSDELTPSLYNKINPELVILDHVAAQRLITKLAADKTRQKIVASTHQGMQLVPLEDIYYFAAEHKYVTVYHTNGQLLIADSLNSLATEFAQDFLRIHRKTLVAVDRIAELTKDAKGKCFIKLCGLDIKLEVSRRQLPQVRQAVRKA